MGILKRSEEFGGLKAYYTLWAFPGPFVGSALGHWACCWKVLVSEERPGTNSKQLSFLSKCYAVWQMKLQFVHPLWQWQDHANSSWLSLKPGLWWIQATLLSHCCHKIVTANLGVSGVAQSQFCSWSKPVASTNCQIQAVFTLNEPLHGLLRSGHILVFHAPTLIIFPCSLRNRLSSPAAPVCYAWRQRLQIDLLLLLLLMMFVFHSTASYMWSKNAQKFLEHMTS